MKSFIVPSCVLILLQFISILDIRCRGCVSASKVLDYEVDIPIIFKRKHLIEDNEKDRLYSPKQAFEKRAKILDSVCTEYSNPINPEFFALFGSYYDSDKMELETSREFQLGRNMTSCVPKFIGSDILSNFLSRIGSNYDESDSMDPCSAKRFLAAAEPDMSQHPVEHPDYPGVYYVPGRRNRTLCDIKSKLHELNLKISGAQHPMKRIANIYSELSTNQTALSSIIRKELDHFWSTFISFSDFVNFLVENTGPLEHNLIIPYWKMCKMCLPPLRPNIIVKSEHLRQDLNYVVKLLHLNPSDLADFAEIDENVLPHDVKNLFSTLSKNQIVRLYETFRLDHELFGYDVNPFLLLGS